MAQAEISFKYPDGATHFDPTVERVGRKFMELLFAQPPEGAGPFTADTHPLRKFVHPDFFEVTDGRVTIEGLAGLVEYRNNFRNPTLLRAEMLAVPLDKLEPVATADGTHTVNPNFSTLTDFTFNLPAGVPQFNTHVRMWESLDIREDADGRMLVRSRTYWPFGADGPLSDPHHQHAFVGGQVEHFQQYGTEQPMTDWEQVYAQAFPGATFSSETL